MIEDIDASKDSIQLELSNVPPPDKEPAPDTTWAMSLLMLTHDPLRCDMIEMKRALEPSYFGDLPDSWRVNAWFRFFNAWGTLIGQFHAVQVEVYYDYLAVPAGLKSEDRTELLHFQRAFQLELLAVARLEKRILVELATTDWGTHEPWSEAAELLRVRVKALCEDLEQHLQRQEERLPLLLHQFWGTVEPQGVAKRTIQAARAGQLQKRHGNGGVDLLGWMVHYLKQRDPAQAKKLAQSVQGPLGRMLGLPVKMSKYATTLEHLRCIFADEEPRGLFGAPPPTVPTALYERSVGIEEESTWAGPVAPEDSAVERARKASTVNAVLAAANARRRDLLVHSDTTTQELAKHEEPLHSFKHDPKWMNRMDKVPSRIFQKIGMEKKPDTPRRI